MYTPNPVTKIVARVSIDKKASPSWLSIVEIIATTTTSVTDTSNAA